MEMEDKTKVKNTAIKEHFISMQYGQVKEKTNNGMEWLAKRKVFFGYVDKQEETPTGNPIEIHGFNTKDVLYTVYRPGNVTVDNICDHSKSNKWLNLEPHERSRLLSLFANQVEKNTNLFAEIDIISRGILSKDTKKAVPIFAEYLQYYASYCSFHSKETAWKPKGSAVAIIANENPLYVFGMVLGPALAAGYNIILQSGYKVTPVSALIVEIAVSSGIPEGTIRLTPGDVDIETFFTNSNVDIVSCFDDIYKERYNLCNMNYKKFLNFSPYKIPMILLENSDLDSACHSLINAVWGHKGNEPYSVGEVLVQENIFTTFVEKLKNTLNAIKSGPADDKLADVSINMDTQFLEQYKKALIDATDLGIQVTKTKSECADFTPTVVIGGRIYPNNVIDECKVPSVLTVLAFRSINEAVTLANNSKQGFGAVVWSENISAILEVVKTLKVTNVWVNTPPLISPDVPFSPYKSSGCSYIGGSEGFYEYVNLKILQKPDTEFVEGSGDVFDKTVTDAKKAQSALNKLSRKQRASKFRDAIANLLVQRKLASDETSKKFLDSWIDVLQQVLSEPCKRTSTPSLPNHHITSQLEPRGVVVVEVTDNADIHSKKLVAVAIIEGNAIILIDSAKNSLYSLVPKLFPSGVCSICGYSSAVVRSAALHKEVDVYIGETMSKSFSSLPLKDIRKFQTVSDNWEEILRKVTLVKNMWASVGQSFL